VPSAQRPPAELAGRQRQSVGSIPNIHAGASVGIFDLLKHVIRSAIFGELRIGKSVAISKLGQCVWLQLGPRRIGQLCAVDLHPRDVGCRCLRTPTTESPRRSVEVAQKVALHGLAFGLHPLHNRIRNQMNKCIRPHDHDVLVEQFLLFSQTVVRLCGHTAQDQGTNIVLW
jgi:hypothetical protein